MLEALHSWRLYVYKAINIVSFRSAQHIMPIVLTFTLQRPGRDAIPLKKSFAAVFLAQSTKDSLGYSPKGNVRYPLMDKKKVNACSRHMVLRVYFTAEGSLVEGSLGIYSPGTPIPPVGRTISIRASRTVFG